MATTDPATGGLRPVPETPTDPDSGTAIGSLDSTRLLEEANALTLFIARRGNMLNGDAERIAAYERLRIAIDNACDKGNYDFVALLGAYSEVSAFTYEEHGVNGRTILDTDGQGLRKLLLKERNKNGGRWKRIGYCLGKPRNRPLVIGSFLLIAVMGYELLLLCLDDTLRADHNMKEAKKLLVPLAWGALGTCAFLMKQLSDRLSAFAYEEARARGMEARIFLGAILALIVVECIAPQGDAKTATPPTASVVVQTDGTAPARQPAQPLASQPDTAKGSSESKAASLSKNQNLPVPLQIYIIAFLAGLGIKPVYTAIEGLIEGIAARVKLPTSQGQKSPR